MSYSTLPTKRELAKELDRKTYEELIEWFEHNYTVIEFFSKQRYDRGARALLISIHRDVTTGTGEPRVPTLIQLAEFRRALLQ